MRTPPLDRVLHAIRFELIGLALVTPLGPWAFHMPVGDIGVVAIVSATIATIWNYLFNLGFDHLLLAMRGRVRKSLPVRAVHAVLFEVGLLAVLVPFIAWYLGISLLQALLMDASFAIFYMTYAFVFSLAYDHVFPVQERPAKA